MPWPPDDISTAGVNSDQDRPPRAEFFKVFQHIRTIIQARGNADGVASLDSRRRLLDAELGRGVAGGVASLDGNARVPAAQLPPQPAPVAGVPPGTIMLNAGPASPSGWFRCTGSAVSRTIFANLFNAIGTRYGPGDGATTFNIPDLRERFVLSSGNNFALADTGGAAEHALTADEMPEHRHGLAGIYRSGITSGTLANEMTYAHAGDTMLELDDMAQDGVRNAGGSQPHNNMPPYIVMHYIIRT